MKISDSYYQSCAESGDRKDLTVWQGIAYTLIQHGAESMEKSSNAFPNAWIPNARRFML